MDFQETQWMGRYFLTGYDWQSIYLSGTSPPLALTKTDNPGEPIGA
jgi:hypothetical protein